MMKKIDNINHFNLEFYENDSKKNQDMCSLPYCDLCHTLNKIGEEMKLNMNSKKFDSFCKLFNHRPITKEIKSEQK